MPLRPWRTIASSLLLGVLAGPLAAQDAGAPVRIGNQPRVTIQGASVVAFAPALPDSADSTAASWRAVAQRFGFTLRLAEGAPPVVFDRPFNTMHYVPLDVPEGFMLVVPGSRSSLVRGLVAPDSLGQRLRAYLVKERPFSR